MPTYFNIRSSRPEMLEKARRIATEFARPYMREGVVGIVYMGATVRGYFDESSDIDIGIFTKRGAELLLPPQYHKVEGIEIHRHLGQYEEKLERPSDMDKRWAHVEREIAFDAEGKLAELLDAKVPLKPEEKKWLLMSGLALSEWYVNRLSLLWIERGSIASAYKMFDEGLDRFLDMLFALNDALIPTVKWRYFCAEQLRRLPSSFQDRLKDAMMLRAFTAEEIERRRAVFLEMWGEMRVVVEQELGMPYEEINQQV